MIVPIATVADPRVAPYAAVKDRDLARRDGRFIVEGRIALERLVGASRFPVDSVFLSEARLESLAALLGEIDPAIAVYAAPQAVMDGITGFHIHRGVLALARRGEETTREALIADLSTPATVLALVGLANHDNVGACFRNAAAFGADAVLLDETSCDPLYRKAIRVSSGWALQLPFAHSGTGAELLALLDAGGFETWALSPAWGESLQALAPPPRLALLLGAEGPGLPADLIARARRVSIPMAPGVDSLNVAAAGAVALAHVFASRRAGCPPPA